MATMPEPFSQLLFLGLSPPPSTETAPETFNHCQLDIDSLTLFRLRNKLLNMKGQRPYMICIVDLQPQPQPFPLSLRSRKSGPWFFPVL